MIKVVSVRFQNSINLYSYKTDLPLELGDIVAVDSTNNVGLAKVMVENVSNPKTKEKASRWVLCKVDVEGSRQRIKDLVDGKTN